MSLIRLARRLPLKGSSRCMLSATATSRPPLPYGLTRNLTSRRLGAVRMNSASAASDLFEQQPLTNVEDSYSYSSGEEVDVSHLISNGTVTSHISPYWVNQLKLLHRPVARNLVAKINPNNALGYESFTGPPKKGTLLENIIQWKKLHGDKVILTRVGEFYECYGVDALMLINYAGLNAMAGAAKAGCPIRNVQATLDALTQVGLSVAVYEEIGEVESGRGPVSVATKAKLKNRVLSQIVSPASSTYIYDNMCLRSDDIEFRENRPAVGILRTVNGYTLCQVYVDTGVMSIAERLTEEGVRSLLSSSGYIEPLYVQDCSVVDLPFLHSTATASQGVEKLTGYSETDFPDQVLRRVSRRLEISVDNVRVCNRNQYANTLSSSNKATGGTNTVPLMPIYTSTALQIGLIPNENVPDLISQLLPSRTSAYISRFLRKWLLNPPPAEIADQLRVLCKALLQQSSAVNGAELADTLAVVPASVAVPRFAPVSIAKVVTLINAHQCNNALFQEIRHNIHALQLMLRQAELHTPEALRSSAPRQFASLVTPLLALTSYECGVQAEYAQLLQETAEVLEKIDFVIPVEEAADLPHTDPHSRIPAEFFLTNEEEFRNKVVRSHPEVKAAYRAVEDAATALCNMVNAQFPEGYVVQYDINNNAILLRNELIPGRSKDKSKSPVEAFPTKNFEVFVDRKGKTLSKSYTTPEVSAALHAYQEATTRAGAQVSKVLQSLSGALQGRHLISIIQAAHWAVILESATLHAMSSKQKGWVVPEMTDFPADSSDESASSDASLVQPALQLSGLSPYWMDRATCALNPVRLQGIYLLTAPNMSGKSTLMRSVLVAALLANCGLCVPCDAATVPRYDHYFLRTASYDVPSEAKSAFALEMDDVRVVLRDCTHRSLVMIDELGKGTSAKDGSALSGALLEHLDQRRLSGIFSTHLHELFRLPLQLKSVTDKKMGFAVDETGRISWNYHLEDGRCTDSMALVTARKYGISADVIHRAEALARQFDDLCRNDTGRASPSTEERADRAGAPSTAKYQVQDAPVDAPAVSAQEHPSHHVSMPNRVPSWADESRPAGRRYHLSTDVAPVVRSLLNDANAVVQVVPAAWETPVGLEGTSCVYVLQLYSLTKEFLPDVLYVGETESVRQRLKQHRDHYKALGYSFNAAVVPVSDKSAARRLETSLIHALKGRGFDIENDSDSRHVLFSRK